MRNYLALAWKYFMILQNFDENMYFWSLFYVPCPPPALFVREGHFRVRGQVVKHFGRFGDKYLLRHICQSDATIWMRDAFKRLQKISSLRRVSLSYTKWKVKKKSRAFGAFSPPKHKHEKIFAPTARVYNRVWIWSWDPPLTQKWNVFAPPNSIFVNLHIARSPSWGNIFRRDFF